MTKDFSKIKLFWGDKLQTLPSEFLDGFGLEDQTFYYLTTIGLPNNLENLNHAIEINFYFQKERIIKRELKGISYCIIGDDSGTQFGISLLDNQLYAVDFDKLFESEPVCFVNSTIDKFIETIQLFIEFQKKSHDRDIPETELLKLMKVRMEAVDEKSIAHPKTWWSTIINDPIGN
jgi:hypothetical protein